MKVDLTAEVAGTHWESRMIPPEVIEGAQSDPAAWKEVQTAIRGGAPAAFMAANAWGEAQQVLTKLVGANTGIPKMEIAGVVDNVAGLLLSPPDSLGGLGSALAQTGIGIVTEALAAVPVVGAIARGIGGIINLLVGLATMDFEVAREVVPPLEEYEPRDDEYAVNNWVLGVAATSSDWQSIFSPRYAGASRWVALERESGWAFRPAEASDTGNQGFMPGTQRCTRTIQTYFIFKSERVARDPSLSVNMAHADDTGAFFPGVAQLSTALSGKVQRAGTWLWCIDPERLRSDWSDYFAGARELAVDLWDGRASAMENTTLGDLNDEQRRAVARAFYSRFLVSSVDDTIGGFATDGWTPDSQAETAFERFIAPWCDTMKQRQAHHLRTRAVAYAARDSPGVHRDLDTFDEMRRLLLEHPDRRNVTVEDIVDADYRHALTQSIVGGTLAAPVVGPPGELAPGPPDAEPQLPLGGAPFDDDGDDPPGTSGGAAVAVALGLLGLGGTALAIGRRRTLGRRGT